MPSVGPQYPTAAQTVSESPYSNNTWSNPTYVASDDGSGASITATTFDSPDYSYVLKAYTFDFSSIPAGATIDGVFVEVEARQANGAVNWALCQLLDTSRAKTGDNKGGIGAVSSSWTKYDFGGSSDKWGCALTRDWIVDADFGVAIAFQAAGTDSDIYVDYVRVTVYYTESSATPINISDSGSGADALSSLAARVPVSDVGGVPSADVDLVANTAKITSSGSVTSDAIDTTGATLLIACSGQFYSEGKTLSDSKGNTWYPLTKYGTSGSAGFLQIYYAYGSGLSVGTGHTFSVSGSTSYASIAVLAFSGFGNDDPFADLESGNYNASYTYTIECPSISPSSGMLLVSFRGDGTSLTSGVIVDEDFVEVDDIYDGSNYSIASAWKTSDGSSSSPLWETASQTTTCAVQAAFTPVSGGETIGVEEASGSKSVSDSGSGADAISDVSAGLELSDVGAGAEGVGLLAGVGLSDVGSGADSTPAVSAGIPQSDVGSGADAAPAISADVSQSDVGSGLDAEDIDSGAAPVPIEDSGAGVDDVDEIEAELWLSDAGVGADGAPVISSGVAEADLGEGADDDPGVLAKVAAADSGTGAEGSPDVSPSVPVVDSGAGVDSTPAIGSSVPQADVGSGVDDELVSSGATPVPVGDSGAGVDSDPEIGVSVIIGDEGVGAYVKIGGAWVGCSVYVKVGGAWVPTAA